jgi:hypothetical protein
LAPRGGRRLMIEALSFALTFASFMRQIDTCPVDPGQNARRGGVATQGLPDALRAPNAQKLR